jgi:FecR protein
MAAAELRKLRPFLRVTLASLAIAAAGSAQEQKSNPAGKLYVTNTSGGILVSNGAKIDQMAKKAVYNAEGTTIETEANSNASMVLSNSTGLYLDGGTRIQIREFSQEAFRPNRSDLEQEPSASHTKLFVEYGSVGLSTGKLASESTLEIDTPDASASVHGGQLVIKVIDGATQISVIHGTATVRAGSSGAPMFVKSGQEFQVRQGGSGQSASGVVQEMSATDSGGLPQVSDADVENAQAAQKLVYFNVQNPTGGGIEIFDGDAAQGGSSTQGPATQVVAIPVVPATPPVQLTVSAANLTSTGS